MNIENHFILCHDTGEVDMQVIAFGQEGYHLVSCTEVDGLWYLTFSNWASCLMNNTLKSEGNLKDET